ncbi:hypothetical protein DFJ58DRAFT_837988 [Suillus subalutaceus]|uniref:uncharacterized protein n=1 Tax=Suillus subalutaceus TaxID=48586 RepID=UPI001B885AC5|nr:uncharacterized protein DFJ58DRAFT_837988 [Suillus subalutaceus]KAG1868354.1 hypothetical protein DFJ58DRAFT_837988 [Suillus subalutaceus]
MTIEHPSSASDTSSQSGMADNETEPEQQSEISALTAPAPKKKRTRTLTTPHQSAVLHALLSQSRFPTTAMREEVGRQIGLSARKVQIWFQNQRQKARRPQSDSAPLSRPAQFGPFPSAPQSASSSHTAPDVPMSESFPNISEASASRNPVPRSGPSLDPGLSGPGIPGRRTSPYPASSEEYSRIAQSPDSTSSMPNRSSRGLEEFPSLTLREPIPRMLASRSLLMHEGAQSPPSSRMLPPIHFSALDSRISTDPYMSSTSSFPLPPSQPSSSTSIMHHHEPTRHTEHRISTVLGIPPPFALQPQPQWDPNSFAPFTRPEFASFSSPSRSTQFAPGSFFSPGSRDRFALHVSPELPHTREYHPSLGERQLSSSSVPRPSNTFRDIIDPQGYPARESSSADHSRMRTDDDEPRQNC